MDISKTDRRSPFPPVLIQHTKLPYTYTQVHF